MEPWIKAKLLAVYYAEYDTDSVSVDVCVRSLLYSIADCNDKYALRVYKKLKAMPIAAP